MRTFYRLLWRLPSWHNFGSPITVILMPGEILNEESKRIWDRGANDNETPGRRVSRVRWALIDFYTSRRMGFSMYANSMAIPIEDENDGNAMTGYVDILGRQIEYEPSQTGDRVMPLPPPGPARTARAEQILSSSAQPSPDRHDRPQEDGKAQRRLRIDPQGKVLGKTVGKTTGKPSGKPPGLPQSSPQPDDALPDGRGGDSIPNFPHSTAQLLAPLSTLPHIATNLPMGEMHDALRSASGRPVIWGHWLNSYDELYALNSRPWLAAVLEYHNSARPASNEEALAVDPARAMAWILTHMSLARQSSIEQLILQFNGNDFQRDGMQLQAAQLIRTALETLPMTTILGHPAEIMAAGDDVATANEQWRSLLAQYPM